jgi:hypothetical protein
MMHAANDNEPRRPRVDLRLLSPCPPGWDTVLGYIAKANPDLFELMDKVPSSTLRDGYWLTHRCREQGVVPLKVPACHWLRKAGIEQVNAYPLSLLEKRLG